MRSPISTSSCLGTRRARVADGPVPGGELEVPALGPMREDAEQVAQIDLGIEPMQARRGDEREDVTRCRGVVVASYRHPGLSSDSNSPELALGAVSAHVEVLEDFAHDWRLRDGREDAHLLRALRAGERVEAEGSAQEDLPVYAAADVEVRLRHATAGALRAGKRRTARRMPPRCGGFDKLAAPIDDSRIRSNT